MMKKLLGFSLLLLLNTLGSAFAIELCQADLQVGFVDFKTNHIWNRNGKKISTYSDFHLRAIPVYLDTYITTIDCLSINSAYIWIEEELNGTSRGIADSELTWTHFFYLDKINTVSFQTTAIIPSGKQIYNLRYGKWGGQFDILYSRVQKIKCQTLFFDSIIGYRFYKGFPSDQVRGYLSCGSYVFKNIYLDGSLNFQYGLFNGKSKFNYPLYLLNPNYRLLRADLKAAYCFYNQFYLSAGVFKHLWGQNVATGSGYFIEGWIKY